jgi:hypothetical protein
MKYEKLKLPTKPLIEGRVPTPCLLDIMHQVKRKDFYNQRLTETELKRRISKKAK